MKETKFHEFGRAIGEGRAIPYLVEDAKQTAQDFSHMYKEIVHVSRSASKWTLKNLGSILAKSTYPVTGNLSVTVRGALEEGLGEKIYNSKHSGVTSAVTNMIAYPSLAGYLTGSGSVAFFSFLMGAAEGFLARPNYKIDWREGYSAGEIPDFSRPIRGSLLGKIASLPLEMAIGVYDGMKHRERQGCDLEGKIWEDD